jgi:hypothetical protein
MKIHTAKHAFPISAILEADRHLCNLNYDGDRLTPIVGKVVRLATLVILPGRWLGDWHDLPAGAAIRLISIGDAAMPSVFEVESD